MDNSNNLNSQFNNNQQSNPTRPVTNKFFPAGLFDDEINEVNSSTTNGANSQFINGAAMAGNSTTPVNQPQPMQSPEVLDLFDEGIETLMDDVNGTTTYASPLINEPQQGPVPGPSNVNPVVNNQEMNANGNNQNWMNEQPLSMGGLGVNTLVGEDAPKEVVENNKFIQPRNYDPVSHPAVVPEVVQQVNSAPSIYNNFNEQLPEIDEVKVCKEYVGEAFTKITMSPFSFCGFLFGGIYFIYRKLYLLGLIVLGIEVAILNLIPVPISIVVDFVYRLVLALIVNHIYIGTAKKKVKSLHKHKPKMNQYELSMLAKKKGGTSLVMAILALILYSGIVAVIGISLNFKEILNLLPKNDTPVINEDSEGVTGYNGDLTYEEYNVLDRFNITIPEGFTKEGTTFTYVYRVPLPVEEPEENKEEPKPEEKPSTEEKPAEENKEEEKPKVEYSNNKCTLSFNAVKGYKDEEDLIKSIAYYYTHSEDEGVASEENNAIKWQTFTSDKENEKIYYRVTKQDDKLLLFVYKMEFEDENKVCENFYNQIYSSMSLKE